VLALIVKKAVTLLEGSSLVALEASMVKDLMDLTQDEEGNGVLDLHSLKRQLKEERKIAVEVLAQLKLARAGIARDHDCVCRVWIQGRQAL
jgi:hypothetical protein